MRAILALLLAAPFAACLGPAPALEGGATGLAGPRVTLGVATEGPAAPLFWTGQELAGPAPPPVPFDAASFACEVASTCKTLTCEETACERVPFRLDVPSGWWDAHEGGLTVAVAWPKGEGEAGDAHLAVEVRDASGATLARGEVGWFASVVVLDAPESGEYEAVVVALDGTTAYDGVLRLDARPSRTEVRDLLPDIVTMPPIDLRIDEPAPEPFTALTGPFSLATGSRGCAPLEVLEGNAKRCLRFSNGIGNVGEGPLEARLAVAEGLAAIALATGDFVQRIAVSDGTFRDEAVARAEFHPAHSHFHYSELARYAVYEYDLDAGKRGAEVGIGRKAGFCFLDSGLVDLANPRASARGFTGVGCQTPSQAGEWFMGVSPGWYDLYYWGLDDQYVEMSDAKDGVYELVSTANAAGTLLEADRTNNEASAVFRLQGSEIEVLWTRSAAESSG